MVIFNETCSNFIFLKTTHRTKKFYSTHRILSRVDYIRLFSIKLAKSIVEKFSKLYFLKNERFGEKILFPFSDAFLHVESCFN